MTHKKVYKACNIKTVKWTFMVSSKWRTARGDGLLKTETNIKKEKKRLDKTAMKNCEEA